MPYYTRSYNPQPTTRVASTDLKNEFQAIDNALDNVETDVGKGIRAPEATTVLPNAASRANKVLSFDGSGNPAVPIAVVDLTNAVTAASNAATSETNAAASATAAAGSASTASTQASNASTSATNAASSASAASTSATNAATSASTATTQASNASTSATNAASSASAAATSATNAANSATTAGTHATNAGNSASAAATSASNVALTEKLNLGSKTSNPTVDNQGGALLAGALYYNSVADETRVYTGSSWKAAGSAVNGTSARYSYTATASQTTFSATYDVGYVDVYLNGLKLAPADFTATSGTSVVLASGAALNDVVDIVGYGAFEVANHYTKPETDTLLAGKASTASVAAKQDTLVSGTSIKTVNSTSLLGSGDVAVQPTLVSGTNIKTVGGQSILGSGDLTVGGIPNVVRSARTSNTILAAGDKGTLIDVTSGTFTQTLTAAATLGSGWWCYLANTGTGTVTVDPNASELIGGVATATLRTGDVWLLVCTGTAFDLKRLAGNTVVVLTSGTSYTVEAGVYRLVIELWGGGGGGGSDASSQARASGGGAGGYCMSVLSVTPGQVIDYYIGAGGAGLNTALGQAGNSGGATGALSSTLLANGGQGGTYYTTTTSVTLAAGGSATGGLVNIQGGGGRSLANSNQSLTISFGGDSPNGGRGACTSLRGEELGVSQNAQIPGGGGAGVWSGVGNSIVSAGARGEIRIRFI